MKVAGQFTFSDVTPETVWDWLTNPDHISECLPGCEGLDEIEKNRYRMNMRVGIGSIRSSYTGTIHIHDLNPHQEYSLKVTGKGGGGFVEGTGTIQLEPDQADTQVSYTGNIAIGGRTASVGQRMVSGAARMVIEQFFKCVASKLSQGESSLS
jgi:carbon monoxide dehydrogenase subunit G